MTWHLSSMHPRGWLHLAALGAFAWHCRPAGLHPRACGCCGPAAQLPGVAGKKLPQAPTVPLPLPLVQVGSFVPADSLRMHVMDAIFTRMGGWVGGAGGREGRAGGWAGGRAGGRVGGWRPLLTSSAPLMLPSLPFPSSSSRLPACRPGPLGHPSLHPASAPARIACCLGCFLSLSGPCKPAGRREWRSPTFQPGGTPSLIPLPALLLFHLPMQVPVIT